MKKYTLTLIALAISSILLAQEGIHFSKGSLDDILAKAKNENKMVFMDCYTSWCGPCKMLSENIFPQKEVGDFFNAKFISIKMDMEKGEGIDLMEKCGVKVFPTLLFMDARGKVIHTLIGYSEAETLISEAKISLDPNQRLSALEKRYANGDRDVKFILKYIQTLKNAFRREKMAEVGKEFVSNTPVNQLCNEDAFAIIECIGLGYGSEAYKYFIASKGKFIAIEGIGQKKYDQVIGDAVYNYVSEIAKTGSMEDLTSAIDEGKKIHMSPEQLALENYWYSTYYLKHKEFANWFDRQIADAKIVSKTDKKEGESMIFDAAYRVVMDSVFRYVGIYGKAIAEVENLDKNDKDLASAYYCLAFMYKKESNKEKALENINIYLDKKGEDKKNELVIMAIKLKKEIESM